MGCVFDWRVVTILLLTVIKGLDCRPNGYTKEFDYLCRSSVVTADLKAVEFDCTGYVQCNSRHAIWMNCPGNLVFIEGATGCRDPPRGGPCKDPKLRADMYCPTKRDLKFPHPKSCSMYYDCQQTVPQMGLALYENECVYPLLFDSYNLRCAHPDLVKCGSIRAPGDRCDYKLECIDKSCKGLKDGLNPDGMKYFQPDYMNCKSQLVVEKLRCPEGEVFDPLLLKCSRDITASLMKRCSDIPLLRFSSHLSCAKYYDCRKMDWHSGWQAYLTECPYFQLFDPISRQCTTFSSVSCDNRPEPKAPCDYDIGHCSTGTCIPCEASCVGHPDGYTVYPGDPSRYLECRSERTIKIENCPGSRLFWNGMCRRASDIPPDAFVTTTPAPTTTSTKATTISTESATSTQSMTSSTTVTTESAPSSTTPADEATTTAATTLAQDEGTTQPTTPVATTPGTEPRTDAGSSCPTPPPLETLDGVIVSIVYDNNKTKASYTCKSGYAMCGAKTSVFCTDGVWEKPSMDCVQSVWGPPSVPGMIQVMCPLTPWTIIHVEAMLMENGIGKFELLNSNDKPHVNVEFSSPTDENYNMRINSATMSSTEIPEAFSIGDSVQLDVTVGMDGYTIKVNGHSDTFLDFVDGLHSVVLLKTAGIFKANTIEITPSNVAQLITSPEFEDSSVINADGFFTFSVHSCEDVTIILSSTESLDLANSIQLNLGRKSNRESTVKMCADCPIKRIVHAPLSCNKIKAFWIRLRPSIEKTVVDIGTGFGMNPDTVLLSGLRSAGHTELRSVFVTSPTDGASIYISHPVIERCGVPPQFDNGYPVIKPTGNDLQYRCERDHAFCGQSDVMTCAENGQYAGLWGACFRSVFDTITTSTFEKILGCRFEETSAISLHVAKGSSDILIQLKEGATPNLDITISADQMTFQAYRSGTALTPMVSPMGALNLGTSYHIVIYNTKDRFKIYVDGKLEGSHTNSHGYKDISRLVVSSYQQLSRVEFAPTISGTCSTPPDIPNSMVEGERDDTFGSELPIACAPNYTWCGIDDSTLRCSSYGTWSGSPGHCVRVLWSPAQPLTEDIDFPIPHCYSESIDFGINIELTIQPSGSSFAIEVQHDEVTADTQSVTFDVPNNEVTVSSDTRPPTPFTSTNPVIDIIITQGTIEFYYNDGLIGRDTYTHPKSSFHNVLVSAGGATLNVISIFNDVSAFGQAAA